MGERQRDESIDKAEDWGDVVFIRASSMDSRNAELSGRAAFSITDIFVSCFYRDVV